MIIKMQTNKKKIEILEKVKSFGARPQGSENLKKFSYFLKKFSEKYGFECALQEYPSKFWDYKSVNVEFNSETIKAFVNPYTQKCDIEANFKHANSIEQLRDLANNKFTNEILVFYGQLSKETLFPLEYPFYNLDEHKEIYNTLKSIQPLALIFISHSITNLPLFNIDEQFDIPTITISPLDGIKLLEHKNQKIKLKIDARNKESSSYNVIMSKKGKTTKKIVIFAHMDTVHFSPGAHDNSSGIICLLKLIEELPKKELEYSIELVAASGHEYTGKGEHLYYSELIKNPSEIRLFINVDGVGHWIISDKVAFYNFLDDQKTKILKLIEPILGNCEGEQWPQGLHYPLSFQNISCITISAGESLDIHHTPNDTFDYLNLKSLDKVAMAIREIIINLKNI